MLFLWNIWTDFLVYSWFRNRATVCLCELSLCWTSENWLNCFGFCVHFSSRTFNISEYRVRVKWPHSGCKMKKMAMYICHFSSISILFVSLMTDFITFRKLSSLLFIHSQCTETNLELISLKFSLFIESHIAFESKHPKLWLKLTSNELKKIASRSLFSAFDILSAVKFGFIIF